MESNTAATQTKHDPIVRTPIPGEGNNWVKGMKSPNPNGRPGIHQSSLAEIKKLFSSDARIIDVLNMAFDLALKGDRLMIRLIIDKTLPTIKPVEQEGGVATVQPVLKLVLEGLEQAQQTIIKPLESQEGEKPIERGN